jgi:hypothetical protein
VTPSRPARRTATNLQSGGHLAAATGALRAFFAAGRHPGAGPGRHRPAHLRSGGTANVSSFRLVVAREAFWSSTPPRPGPRARCNSSSGTPTTGPRPATVPAPPTRPRARACRPRAWSRSSAAAGSPGGWWACSAWRRGTNPSTSWTSVHHPSAATADRVPPVAAPAQHRAAQKARRTRSPP